jgi:dipeptidase D
MSSPLSGLEPKIIWSNFDQIRKIPRPSKHEEKILAWLKDWAREKGFPTKQDKTGNLVMQVPATKGHEKAETVVLQGHVDMVPEKNRDTKHDFLTDPIQPERDGDWIIARQTTLGADNGVGVAMALASATEPDVVHGPLELLFTVDEETGLTGANGLTRAMLKGRRLVNLDTEEDGALYIGCAGGADLHATFTFRRTPSRKPEGVQLSVEGLRGGHSGVDIHENRANGIKLLVRILKAALDEGIAFDLVSLDGGSKHNAIPREAFAELRLAKGGTDRLRKVVNAQKKEFMGEFGRIDPDLKVALKKQKVATKVIPSATAIRILRSLAAAPHGVLAMSREVEGLVETSNNTAVVKTTDKDLDVTFSSRSSNMPALRATSAQIRALFELAGAKVQSFGGYPGWEPNPESVLLKKGKEVFKAKFGKEPVIRAIHAGLECGIIGEKFPGMDMISMGPEIRSPHAPGEKVQISSVQKTWEMLKAYLKALA